MKHSLFDVSMIAVLLSLVNVSFYPYLNTSFQKMNQTNEHDDLLEGMSPEMPHDITSQDTCEYCPLTIIFVVIQCFKLVKKLTIKLS